MTTRQIKIALNGLQKRINEVAEKYHKKREFTFHEARLRYAKKIQEGEDNGL